MARTVTNGVCHSQVRIPPNAEIPAGTAPPRAGLCLFHPQDAAREVHAVPAQAEHLAHPHAGVEPEPEDVAGRRNDDLRFDAAA